MTAKASQLEREGHEIIRLSAGEPDCGTPDHIKQAGIKAIQDGKTQYPLCQGIMELREAVCQKLERVNELNYTPLKRPSLALDVSRCCLTLWLQR